MRALDLADKLTHNQLRSVLLTCLRLDVQMHNYGGAMQMWERLQKVGIDQQTAAAVKPVTEQLQQLRTSSEAYQVAGQISDLGN